MGILDSVENEDVCALAAFDCLPRPAVTFRRVISDPATHNPGEYNGIHSYSVCVHSLIPIPSTLGRAREVQSPSQGCGGGAMDDVLALLPQLNFPLHAHETFVPPFQTYRLMRIQGRDGRHSKSSLTGLARFPEMIGLWANLSTTYAFAFR